MRGRERLAVLVASVALGAASAAQALELPDARVTPGAIGSTDAQPAFNAAQVCQRGYARSVRHRYDAEWRRYRTAIFREYGIPHAEWPRFTIDHLVPLELGGRPFGVNGAWDLRNVWPEPKAEAKQKDAVEDELHYQVCIRHSLALGEAQIEIVRDWTRTRVGLPAVRDEASER